MIFKNNMSKKVNVYDVNGNVINQIDLPIYFDLQYREDIISKVYEALKLNAKHKYGSYILAGKETSASGKVRHARRRYRTAYGRGISRVPRKILLRRKPQGFYWVGAFVPSARGGHRAHPPRPIRRERKINKKEKFLALLYALTAIANKNFVLNRYEKLKGKNVDLSFPVIIDGIEKLKKVKDLKNALKKIFSQVEEVIFKEKKIRAGKGKRRGRYYKKSAGLLLIKSKDENINFKTLAIDVVDANKVSVKHLAIGNKPARLTAFTINGLKELDERIRKSAEKLNINLEFLK
ncbi:MAG: 50S ribosomal protein L4 [Candidatus Pacearchaeota archaeon]